MPYVPSRRGWRERVAAASEQPAPGVSADSFAPAIMSARRSRWRLRILLALNAFLAIVYVVSQLDQAVVKKLGPAGEFIYELIHPTVGEETVSPAGQRLRAEVRAVGGEADLAQVSRRFLGLWGVTEHFHVRVNRPEFGDDALASLAGKYGDRIQSLDLRNTKVTDEGLHHLEELSQLLYLTLGNFDYRYLPSRTISISPITDAGLAHLKGLTQLIKLDVSGVPITDAGIGALADLPHLSLLTLNRTKVKGSGLARLKSLPTLSVLYLDGTELTDEGLGSLAGAVDLQMLSVSHVPLTSKSLQALQGLPRLNQLDLTGCGLLDEEVRTFKSERPSLKITRH